MRAKTSVFASFESPYPPLLILLRFSRAKTGGEMNYGYARVSTDKQDTDGQRRALEAAGCEKVIEEQASGRKVRPALASLLASLQASDIVTVYKIDRLSRSVHDFYSIAREIEERGAHLRSLSDPIDTSTPAGRAMMGILAVFAQLEAETISVRVNDGLKAARARGVTLGRRRQLSPDAEARIRQLLLDGADVKALSREYKVDPATIRRIRARNP